MSTALLLLLTCLSYLSGNEEERWSLRPDAEEIKDLMRAYLSEFLPVDAAAEYV